MSMFKSEIPDLPPSGWKTTFEPDDCYPLDWKTRKGPMKYKRKKPIQQVGERTKRRVAENGTETQLFEGIWETREHACEMCHAQIPEALAHCFAHRLGKGRYPEFRYMPNNVALVCSVECHHALDATYSLKTPEGADKAMAMREELYYSLRKHD